VSASALSQERHRRGQGKQPCRLRKRSITEAGRSTAPLAAPINNDLVNAARAGQTLPVKYRLTASDGTGISDPASFVRLTSQQAGGRCGTGLGLDVIEACAPVGSGLQYVGDGKLAVELADEQGPVNQCRTMTLTLSDGSAHTATFQFM
jgi:hypothetical protein